MEPALVPTVALSVLIGLSLGLLGGGGSILTVPILIYAAGLEEKAAIATSLVVVGLTSAVAALPSVRKGGVAWRVALLFAAASMLGAFIGGRVAAFIPGSVLLLAFAGVMAVAAIAMWRGRRMPEPSGAPLATTKVLAIGVGVGLVTGLVGAGGGFLIVPALVLWGGLTMQQAIASSLVVIAMNSGAGLLGYLSHVAVDVRLAALVTAAAIVGSLVGAAYREKLPALLLRRGFAVFVGAMATVLLAQRLG